MKAAVAALVSERFQHRPGSPQSTPSRRSMRSPRTSTWCRFASRERPTARTQVTHGWLPGDSAKSRSRRRLAGWTDLGDGLRRSPRRRQRGARCDSRVARSRSGRSGTRRLASCSVQPYGYWMSCSTPPSSPTSAVDERRHVEPAQCRRGSPRGRRASRRSPAWCRRRARRPRATIGTFTSRVISTTSSAPPPFALGT